MFTIKVDENLSLGLVEKRHAQELFNLTDASRTYLREWLPWVDFTKTRCRFGKIYRHDIKSICE